MNKKKEGRLVNKLNCLLRRLKVPKYLHHFGPKTYEFYEHLQALIIRALCKLSYARVKYLLDMFRIRCQANRLCITQCKEYFLHSGRRCLGNFKQNVLSSCFG